MDDSSRTAATPAGVSGPGLAGPKLKPRPSSALNKRSRPKSGNDLALLDGSRAPQALAEPLVHPKSGAPPPGEPMARYFARVKEAAAGLSCCSLEVKDGMDEDGLYLHKRPIRGLGAGNPLAVGGTVFHHTILYLKRDGKITGLEYGPDNMQDVTENFMEEAESRPVLMNGGEHVTVPAEDTLPFLLIKAPLHSLAEKVVQEAFEFCHGKKYHVVHNNCIHSCDFLVRVLTGGIVKSAPMIYDALCGDVPAVDPPMLMMLPLLMQKTWHQACDGGALMAEFVRSHSFPPIILPEEAISEPGAASKRAETQAATAAAASAEGIAANEILEAAGDNDPKQFNNFNYWGKSYLDHLHVVPDDA